MQILVVKDKAKVAEALREGLQAELYEVTVALTGEDGFYEARAAVFDSLSSA